MNATITKSIIIFTKKKQKKINFSGFHLLDYWLAKNVHSFSLEDYSNPVQQYEKNIVKNGKV